MTELIIIKTNNIDELKNVLLKNKVQYQIIHSENLENLSRPLFADYDRVLQDQNREQEAKELENAEEEDIVDEE